MTNPITTPADAITTISESKQFDTGVATDAGTLTGVETLPVSRSTGLLTTSLSNIGNFILSGFGVSTVAALRALPTLFFTRANTVGYSVPGDGGHGQYYFTVSASPPVDNGVTTLRSNDGRGYWSLIHNGVIDIKQAGATAGLDCSAAVTNAVAAVKASNRGIEKIVFSPMAGGYLFANQVLFNASNVKYELLADWTNTSTVYQTPWVFANDLLAQPASALSNVEIIGNESQLNMNGAAIATANGISLTVVPATFPSPLFNYIQRLRVRNTRFTNGVYDSCNLRQCQDHVLDSCEFTNSVLYLSNGLNITTDFATFVQGNYSTYSHGVTRDCTAYGNASMGMTYYNCSGGTFINGRSYNNAGSGFSYEAPPGQSTAKYVEGRFVNCKANNNGWNGYYITQSGVVVDADCRSYGNGTLGVATDVSGLQMCGVVVAGADKVQVYGDHLSNARHGATFLGAASLTPTWECGGRYDGNAALGINVQGLWRMLVKPSTVIRNNGNTLVSGVYSAGMNVSNSAYNTNGGIMTADGLLFDGNGLQAAVFAFVDSVSTKNNISYNDNASHGTGGSGFVYNNLGILECQDNLLRTPNGNTSNGYVINNTVTKGYVWGNKSDQLTGNVMTNSASSRFGISSATKMTVGTYTAETALPATGTATLADVTNVLATLLVAAQDGLMQS